MTLDPGFRVTENLNKPLLAREKSLAPRNPRASVTPDEPVPEAVEDAPEPTEPSDEEVQAAINEAIAENQAKYAAANRQISITDLYDEFTNLVLSKVKGTRYAEFRTEQSAIKVLELTLFWAMNNRQQPQQPSFPQIPTEEVGGEGELVGPAPDEIIEPAPTDTEEAA